MRFKETVAELHASLAVQDHIESREEKLKRLKDELAPLEDMRDSLTVYTAIDSVCVVRACSLSYVHMCLVCVAKGEEEDTDVCVGSARSDESAVWCARQTHLL